MPSIGPTELMIVLVLALLVLSPRRLPEAGRSLGRGIKEFKGSVRGVTDELTADTAAGAEEA